MRPLGVLLGIVIAIGALSGVIWLGRYSPWGNKPYRKPFTWEYDREKTAEAEQKSAQKANTEANAKQEEADKKAAAAPSKVEPKPPIADHGPYPKAVTGERVFEFGKMGVHEEMKHKFRIENKGDSPLAIAKGPTNCTCTISNLSKREIAPGSFAEVEMSWAPTKTDPTFAKTATIYTNDPELSEIQFKIFGEVVEKFVIIPKNAWYAGHITDIQDGKITGVLGSAIEKAFKILGVEPTNPHVKVDYEPMIGRELSREQMRSGYKFHVHVDRDIPMGHFRSQLRIHTSLEGNKTVEVEVTALRSGPILYLVPIAKDMKVYWNVEKSLLNMGRFSHNAGQKVELPAIIYGVKEKFQVLDVKTDPSYVKVSVVPDPQTTKAGQQGVRFVFEVPPGSPVDTRISPDACHVTIKTNHPVLKEIKFDIEFVSGAS